MTVLEIVRAYLVEHGYDGLAGDDCGCLLSDLAPCGGNMNESCTAGHRVDGCTCGEGHDYHIVPGKRSEEPHA